MNNHPKDYFCNYCYFVSGVLIELCTDCDHFQFDQQTPITLIPSEKNQNVQKKQYTIRYQQGPFENRRKYKKKKIPIISSFNNFIMKDKHKLNPYQLQVQTAFEETLIRIRDSLLLKQNKRRSSKIQILELPANKSQSDIRAPSKKYYVYEFSTNMKCKSNWITSYHGTSLLAIQSIFKQGLKVGLRQFFEFYKNTNSLSSNFQKVGRGIYLSTKVTQAEPYCKDLFYQCILECKVFLPNARIPQTSPFFLVADAKDIVPCSLLIKKKTNLKINKK